MMRSALVVLLTCLGCSSAALPPDGGADGGGGGDAGSTCDGLDQAACEARPDCVADFCDHYCLICGPQFIQCRAPQEEKYSCLALFCQEEDCDDNDAGCPSGKRCAGLTSWELADCCECARGCASDGDCDGGICEESTQCGCGQVCKPSCQTVDCSPGFDCQPDGHCVKHQCGAAGPCPALFECDAGTCERQSCVGTCDGGACIRGECWPTTGLCLLTTP